ncbi:MAG: hypothetical protein U9R52_04335, partial [Candidatus Omnitrophota bacterium]|nr:hypothetical protein [Candidatus Omnitrophota bacterium]
SSMTKKSKKKIIQSLHHVPSLRETLARMTAEDKISREKEQYIVSNLEEWVTDSKYILLNLGVHIGIGFVRFTAMPLPLPIGSTLRPFWVMANRMYCNIRLDWHRKRIHSLPVLFFAFIPFLGYFAYTIPLKKKSEYLTYLYAQHISYMLYGAAMEQKLEKAPAFIRKIGYMLLIPKELVKKNMS